LADVQVEEAADLSLRVGARALLLDATDRLHLRVEVQQVLRSLAREGLRLQVRRRQRRRRRIRLRRKAGRGFGFLARHRLWARSIVAGSAARKGLRRRGNPAENALFTASRTGDTSPPSHRTLWTVEALHVGARGRVA